MPLRSSLQFYALDEKKEEFVRGRARDAEARTELLNYFCEQLVVHNFDNIPVLSAKGAKEIDEEKKSGDSWFDSGVFDPKRALRYVFEIAESKAALTEDFFKELHRLVGDQTDPLRGRYRTMNLEAAFAGHPPPDFAFVGKAMDTTLQWITAESFKEIHPVEQAALLLMRLFEIQPFSSANLVVAQLASSYCLVVENFPFPIIRRDELDSFYTALERALRIWTKDLIDFYVKIVNRSLDDGITRLIRPRPSIQI